MLPLLPTKPLDPRFTELGQLLSFVHDTLIIFIINLSMTYLYIFFTLPHPHLTGRVGGNTWFTYSALSLSLWRNSHSEIPLKQYLSLCLPILKAGQKKVDKFLLFFVSDLACIVLSLWGSCQNSKTTRNIELNMLLDKYGLWVHL